MSHTVLLINPPIYDFAAYDFFNKPLGLLYIASFLRRVGYQVRLIDCLDRNHPSLQKLPQLPKSRPNGTGKYFSRIIETPTCLKHVPRHYRRYGLGPEQFAQALETETTNHRPMAVLVTSMMTYWYRAVADTIKHIRLALPGVPVALGGVYATLMPEHARAHCAADVVFTGRAQIPLLKWLDSIASVCHRDYQGLSDDFAAWPAPAYDLYPRLDYLTLMTSLGCPFRCDYCASGLLQPRLEQLEPQLLIEQINKLLPLLARPRDHFDIAFMDDALLARPETHIIPILELLKETNKCCEKGFLSFPRRACPERSRMGRESMFSDEKTVSESMNPLLRGGRMFEQQQRSNLPLRFHCPNGLHCRLITPQVANLMYGNHFQMIRLSFESADAAPLWQQAGDHKVADRDLAQAVENLEKAGFKRSQLEAYILTGLPGQTMNEIEQSADFVHNLRVQLRLCQYSPIAGTRLFEISPRRYGIDPDEPLLHNNSILPALDKRVSFAAFQQFKNHVAQLNRSLG